MRVYEFAKQQNLSAKEVVELLKEGGFEISSHMSVLDNAAQEFLEKKFMRSNVSKNQQSITPESAPIKKEAFQKRPQSRQAQTRYVPERPTQKPEPKKQQPKQLGVSIEPMMLSDFAENAGKPVTDVILLLLKWGSVYTKNQVLPEELIAKLVKHYAVPVLETSKKEETKLSKDVESGQNIQQRLPIVVVVGHVDHGKTTLLDFIRKTRVAAKEKGGITQHLGAYEAVTPQGNLVFLDTPGHEAFSKIRARGVKVADIAVLVVAADDGVMPQTVEAIKHIKSMGVPVVVAINKMDKVETVRIDGIKRELTQHELVPEEWGGDVICVPISAKLGRGVDQLLEMILLQSQIMDLRAEVAGQARGYVLESKFEKGRGAVATIICQRGTVHIGDLFRAGTVVGKVSSIVDSHGKRLQQVGPSIPVLIAGFEALPDAGDLFEVVDKDDYRKARINQEMRKTFVPKATTKDAFTIVVKTDSNSSKEALLGSIEKLNKKLEKGYNIIQSGIGNISESDVVHAANTGAKIIALHVKTEASALQLAMRLGVDIKIFDIIYKLLEDLEAVSEGAKEIKKVKTKIGEATVLKVFDIKNLGVIAGAYIKEGRFNKDGTVIIYRGNRKVGEGSIKSLQRDRKTVKEVHTNFECAFLIDGFDTWQPDDRVECYLELPVGSK